MSTAKIYLNVPYAEKDAAKALGARWDAAQKKWYVAAEKDVSLFAQWQNGTVAVATSETNTGRIAEKNQDSGVMTYPTDKNFRAYEGDLPPWL